MGLFSRRPRAATKFSESLINEIAIAQVVGKVFDRILEVGLPLKNFHWLNAAAAANPWGEDKGVVDSMLATAEIWDARWLVPKGPSGPRDGARQGSRMTWPARRAGTTPVGPLVPLHIAQPGPPLAVAFSPGSEGSRAGQG